MRDGFCCSLFSVVCVESSSVACFELASSAVCSATMIPSVLHARVKISRMADLLMGWTTTTRERERSGEMTSKLGFSVVAPIRVMRPDSTCGRKASCWALLKR